MIDHLSFSEESSLTGEVEDARFNSLGFAPPKGSFFVALEGTEVEEDNDDDGEVAVILESTGFERGCN